MYNKEKPDKTRLLKNVAAPLLSILGNRLCSSTHNQCAAAGNAPHHISVFEKYDNELLKAYFDGR